MIEDSLNYDYNAATVFRKRQTTLSHISALQERFSALLDDVDVKLLEQDTRALNILTAACKFIRVIEKRYNFKDSSLPLYAGISEDHTMLSHKLVGLLTMKGLVNSGYHLVVGMENRENRIISGLEHDLNVFYDLDTRGGQHTELFRFYNQQNPEFFVRSNMLQGMPDTSSYTGVKRLQFVLDTVCNGRMHVSFTDAPCVLDPNGNEKPFIDIGLVAEASSIICSKKNLHAKDPEGMMVRNRYSLDRLSAEYERVSAQVRSKKVIAFDIMGGAHLLGNSKGLMFNIPVRQSKLALAREAGFKVVGFRNGLKHQGKDLKVVSDSRDAQSNSTFVKNEEVVDYKHLPRASCRGHMPRVNNEGEVIDDFVLGEQDLVEQWLSVVGINLPRIESYYDLLSPESQQMRGYLNDVDQLHRLIA